MLHVAPSREIVVTYDRALKERAFSASKCIFAHRSPVVL